MQASIIKYDSFFNKKIRSYRHFTTLVSTKKGYKIHFLRINSVKIIFYNDQPKKADGITGINNAILKNIKIKNVYNEADVPNAAYFNMNEKLDIIE